MDFIEACLEEIALEGLDGITLSALWLRLETRYPKFSLKLDDDSKDYLWAVVIAPYEGLEFYALKEPRRPLVMFDRFEDQQNNSQNKTLPEDIYPLYLLTSAKSRCDSCAVLGSCSEFYTRHSITSEIRSEAGRARLVLNEAIRRWGERLVIVASQSMRFKALIGQSGLMDDSFSSMNVVTYALLERIGRSRYNGEVSHDYNRLFKMPPKNMFYMRRCLSRLKLITVQQYNLSNLENSLNVNLPGKLCHLTRFKVDYRPKMLVLIHDLCTLLSSAPTQMMRLGDIRARMGLKESTQKKLFLIAKKYVKMEVVPYKAYDPDASEALCLTKSGATERVIKVAVLIKPFSFSTSQADDDEVDDDEEYDDDAGIDDDEFGYPSGDHYEKPGGGGGKSFSKPSDFLLCERTIQDQVYNAVDALGAEGLNKADLVSRLGMSMLESRLVTRNLQRRGLLSGVWMDARKVKYERLVCTRYTKEDKMTGWLQTTNEPSTFSSSSNSSLHGTSAAIAAAAARAAAVVAGGDDSQLSDMTANDSADYFNPSLLGNDDGGDDEMGDSMDTTSISDVATTRKVRASARNRQRIEIILEEISEQKILYNTTPLIRRIRSQEEVYIDRKTLMTLLNLLINMKKIVSYKRYLNLPNGTSQEIVLYCMEGIKESDPMIDGVMEGIAHQAASSSASASGRSIKRNNSVLDSGIDKDDPDYNDMTSGGVGMTGYDLNFSKRLGYLPRMSRMSVLHKYMWYLAYGQHGNSALTNQVKQESDTRDEDTEWQLYLKSPPRRALNEGWVNIGDAVSCMPLSLFCKVTSIPYRIEGLEELVGGIESRYTSICQLPADMYRKILHKRRQVHQFYEECKHLARAGLLTLERAELKEKEQIAVYVHRYGSVVDTTKSLTSGTDTDMGTDMEEQDDRRAVMRRVSRFELMAFSDVQNYWKFLQYVCLNTSQGNLRFSMEDTYRKNVQKRFEDCMRGRSLREVCDRGDIPGDGLGAGGLDSSFWAHRKRNWLNKLTSQLQADGVFSAAADATKPYITTVVKCEPVDDDDDFNTASAAAADFYASTNTAPYDKDDEDTIGFDEATDAERVNEGREEDSHAVTNNMDDSDRMHYDEQDAYVGPAVHSALDFSSPDMKKQRKSMEGGGGTPGLLRIKPIGGGGGGGGGGRVSSGGGGGGKNVGGGGGGVKIKRERKDEIDMLAMQNKTRQRVQWTDIEDNMLLLCVLTSAFMTSLKSRMIVPNKVLRDIMHENFEVSKDKDTDACKRRLTYIMKSEETKQRVNVFLADALHNQKLVEEFRNGKKYNFTQAATAENERMFRLCLQELRSNFKFFQSVEDDYFNISADNGMKKEVSDLVSFDVNWLPDTMEELKERFVMNIAVECGIAAGCVKGKVDRGDVSIARTSPNLREPCNWAELQIAVLHNLIHCALLMTEEDGDRGQELYKLLKSYPETLIDSVFNDLKHQAVITKVKKGIYERKPMGSTLCTYQLSLRYANSFNSLYQRSMYLTAGQVYVKTAHQHLQLCNDLIGCEVSDPNQSDSLIQLLPTQPYAILTTSLVTADRMVLETVVPDQVIVLENPSGSAPSGSTLSNSTPSGSALSGSTPVSQHKKTKSLSFSSADGINDDVCNDDMSNGLNHNDDVDADDDDDDDDSDYDWKTGKVKKPTKKNKNKKKKGQGSQKVKQEPGMKNFEGDDWLGDPAGLPGTVSSRIGLSLSRSQYPFNMPSRYVATPDNVLINSCTVSGRLLSCDVMMDESSVHDVITETLETQDEIDDLTESHLRKELKQWNHNNLTIHPRTCDLILRRIHSIIPDNCDDVNIDKLNSENFCAKLNDKSLSRDLADDCNPAEKCERNSAVDGKVDESLKFCLSVYRCVQEAGMFGLTESEIQNKFSNKNSDQISLQEALTHLSDIHLLVRVGVTEYRYVSVNHADKWSIKVSRSYNHPVCEVADEETAVARLRQLIEMSDYTLRSSSGHRQRAPDECSVIILSCSASSIADAAARAAMTAAADDDLMMDDEPDGLWPSIKQFASIGFSNDIVDRKPEKAAKAKRSRSKHSVDSDEPKPNGRKRASNKTSGRGGKQMRTEVEHSEKLVGERKTRSSNTTKTVKYNYDDDTDDDVEMMNAIQSVNTLRVPVMEDTRDKNNEPFDQLPVPPLPTSPATVEQEKETFDKPDLDLELSSVPLKKPKKPKSGTGDKHNQTPNNSSKRKKHSSINYDSELASNSMNMLDSVVTGSDESQTLNHKESQPLSSPKNQTKPPINESTFLSSVHKDFSSADRHLPANSEEDFSTLHSKHNSTVDDITKEHMPVLNDSSISKSHHKKTSNLEPWSKHEPWSKPDEPKNKTDILEQNQNSSRDIRNELPPLRPLDHSPAVSSPSPIKHSVNSNNNSNNNNARPSEYRIPDNCTAGKTSGFSDFGVLKQISSPAQESYHRTREASQEYYDDRSPQNSKEVQAAHRSSFDYPTQGYPMNPAHHWMQSALMAHDLSRNVSMPTPSHPVTAASSHNAIPSQQRGYDFPAAGVQQNMSREYNQLSSRGKDTSRDFNQSEQPIQNLSRDYSQSERRTQNSARDLSQSDRSTHNQSPSYSHSEHLIQNLSRNFTSSDHSSHNRVNSFNQSDHPTQNLSRDFSLSAHQVQSMSRDLNQSELSNMPRDFSQSVFNHGQSYYMPQNSLRNFASELDRYHQSYPSSFSQDLANLSRDNIGYRLGLGEMGMSSMPGMGLGAESEWMLRRYQLHQQQLLLQQQQQQQQHSGSSDGRYSRPFPQVDGPADTRPFRQVDGPADTRPFRPFSQVDGPTDTRPFRPFSQVDGPGDSRPFRPFPQLDGQADTRPFSQVDGPADSDDDDDVDDSILDVDVDDDDDEDYIDVTPKIKRGRFDSQQSDSNVEGLDYSMRREAEIYGLSPSRKSQSHDVAVEGGRSRVSSEEGSLSGQEPPKVSTYKTVRLVPRPWRTPEGTVNRSALRMMLESMMTTVMENPGITKKEICEKYSNVLQPVPVLELIEILGDIGCIQSSILHRDKALNSSNCKTTLFTPRPSYVYLDASPISDTSSRDIERAESLLAAGVSGDTVYHGTSECVLKLGQFLVQLTASLQSSFNPEADSSSHPELSL